MGYEVEEVYEGVDIRGIASEELFKASTRTMNSWRSNLEEAGWRNSGEAINDVTVDPPREGAQSYEVGGDVIQLAIAEFGRAPGSFPPPSAIGEWVNEQAGMPNKGDSEFDSVVYAVSKSIAESGIEGFRPGTRAFREESEKVADRIQQRIEEQLED